MPTYAKSEDWLLQSSLLLEARPETTRISTRYTIRPNVRRVKKPSSSSEAPKTTTTPSVAEKSSGPPRGHLELKTYDPVSGACLKYRTVKLAEVGRLMQLLGGNKLARTQAGVPHVGDEEAAGGEDVVMAEAGEGHAGSGVATPVAEKVVAGGGGGGGAGGGKGKKKKGKR